MGARSDSSVFKRVRRGRTRLVIDFQYVDKDGKVRRYRKDASVQAMTSARAEAERLKALAAMTGSVDARPLGRTFRTFVESTFEELFMARYRPGTRIRYRGILKQVLLDAFGDLRIDEIGAMQFRTLAADLARRDVQPKGPLNLARTILRAAVEVGELAAMPMLPKLWKESRKLPDAPSEDEVTAMLEHATGWLRTTIALCAFAGLRLSETRALEVRDVDLARACLHVRRALSENELSTPKSGHDRVVPLVPELAAILREATRSKLPRARVIVSADGETPSRQAVYAALQTLQRRHGLRPRSVHSLRHAFCSVLIRRGASVEAVRLLAGHANLSTTQRYVHAAAADLRAAIAKMSTGPALRGPVRARVVERLCSTAIAHERPPMRGSSWVFATRRPSSSGLEAASLT